LTTNLIFFDNNINLNEKFSNINFLLKFNSIDDLSNFILKSGKVSFTYLLVTGSTKLQKFPKFKKLIEYTREDIEFIHNSQDYPPTPYTSPLQVLSKSSYWDNLIKVFFTLFHPLSPVFSIKSFNPGTASQSLLSAMYYCGYKYQPDQPAEVTAYMNNYAEKNIKQLIRGCSLSNAQALAIYSLVYHMEGNISLAQTCQAHATRISYALGLHLDSKIFTTAIRYNRRVLFSKIRSANISFSGFHNLSPSYLTEFGELNPSLILSEWQNPQQCSFIDIKDGLEDFIYSECCTQFIKFNNLYNYNIWNSKINTSRDSIFKSEWNRSYKTISKAYLDYIKVFQSLSSKYPRFKEKIIMYEVHLTMYYHQFMIELYSILKTKLIELNQNEITKILYHCDSLLNFTLSKNGKLEFNPMTQFFIYFTGFSYLNLYPIANLNDKELIKSKLCTIIDSIGSRDQLSNLNYLLLKSGYKSIVNDNN
jgi:hypothetical protein